MKINELVEMYNKNPRIDFTKYLEVQKYIGIAMKQEIAKMVVEGCTTEVDGEIRIDSVARYLLFTMAVISAHTNLEFTKDDAVGDYDLLCESGVLVKIIETFKDDYAQCQEILNMVTTDKLQDSMTIEKKIFNFVDGIENILRVAADKLVEKFDVELPDDFQLNENILMELYNAIKK